MSQPKEQKEKSLQESKGDEDLQFCWGLRKGTINLYESFTLDGTEYFLYDCVYMWRSGQAEPDIAKLVRIWETESNEKKVEVVWFFRPIEIANWLGDTKPLQKEIFLACGHGKGLSNYNQLEAISGKCNVVCSSKHRRNPQPTEEEMRMADYIFYRTFDVERCIISEKFPGSIGGIEVDHFFNKRKCANLSDCSEHKAYSKANNEETPVTVTKNDKSTRAEKGDYRSSAPGTSAGRQVNNSAKDGPCAGAKLKRSEHLPTTSPSAISPPKKRKLLVSSGPTDAALPSRVSGQEKHIITKDSFRENKDLSTRESLDETESKFTERKGPGNKQHVSLGISYKYVEITRRPDMDSGKWLKLEVWSEVRLKEANEKGTLVVLENLDPSFTSGEVEDIIWHVFGQMVKAKMVQRTALSSSHSGQALAIFKTKEAADNVMSQLTKRCLVLGDGRPIVGRRRPGTFGVSGRFIGHLSVDRTRPQRQQREERRNAVATSHFSQGNTIEFEMAVQWRLLQEKTNVWWRALHEEQSQEIEHLMKQMKIPNQK